MEKQTGNEVTYYKIIHNNSLSTSQEAFEIESSCLTGEAAFPIHEEYKLQRARPEFIWHTNAFCHEVLEDLNASKVHNLHKLEQCKSFLKKSGLVVDNIKRHSIDLAERSNRILTETGRQLNILNKDFDTIGQEVHEFRKELNELISNMKK